MSWAKVLWWVSIVAVVADAVMITMPLLPNSTKLMLLFCAVLKGGWCLWHADRIWGSKPQS